MFFDGERSLLVWQGASITVKHFFVVCKHTTATFTNFEGLLTSDVIGLTGDNGTSNWLSAMPDPTYFRNDTLRFPPSGSAAPLNEWAVYSISSATGISGTRWIVGHDRAFTLRGWTGEISHIVAYDIVLSSSDRDQVIADLISRWGIV